MALLCFILAYYLYVSIVTPIYATACLACSIALILYIPMRWVLSQNLRVDLKKSTIYLDIAWLVIFTTAILVYIFRADLYVRPLAFYILMSLAVGIVALKVINYKCQVALTICQIIVIGLCFEWTVTLMYPSLVGLDPYWHQYQTLRIINNTSIGLQSMPVMYYTVAFVMKLFGLSYRLAAMSASFIQMAGDAIMIYFIGKHLLNQRIGLLASLIVAFSGWHIFFGFWIIPNILGMTFGLGILYLAILNQEKRRVYLLLAMLVGMGVLVCTHTISAAWGIAVLGILAFCQLRSKHWKYPLVIFAGCSTIVFCVWYHYGFMNTLLDMTKLKFSPELIGLTSSPATRSGIVGGMGLPTLPSLPTAICPPLLVNYINTMVEAPFWEMLVNTSGMVIGFCIAILGCVLLLSRSRINRNSLFIVLSFGFFLFVGFFPMILGMSFVEHRWWYAAQIYASLPMAGFCLAIRPFAGRILVVIGIVALCFLMIMGLPANMDNDVFSKNQLVCYALSDSEIDAVEYVMDNYEGMVGMDAYYTLSSHIFPGHRERMLNVTNEFMAKDLSRTDCNIVLVRDNFAYEPFSFGEGNMFKLTYDPNTYLQENGWERIFENDGVKVYKRLDGGV